MDKKRVLVVEDDPSLVDLLKIHLTDLHCEVTTAEDGVSGLESAISNDFDLIVLDLMLPKMDGLEVCRQLRQQNRKSPILMLTARSEEIDKILGLEMGADDYLTKPFSVREFIARAKAIFRRKEMWTENPPVSRATSALQFGNLMIDMELRKVTLDGQRIELSPKEFELLSLLASSPGKSYDRAKLLNLIWGYDFEGYEHTVNSHINRLRSKIEPDLTKPKYILTSWGVGYRFNEDI